MADDDLVDDEGKKSDEVDPKAPPAKLATAAERNKSAKAPAKQGALQYLSDPDVWNSDAVKKARRERWYRKKD